MLIKCESIKLGMKIKGTPFKREGALLEFVRSLGARHPKRRAMPKQIECYGDSYTRNYAKQV